MVLRGLFVLPRVARVFTGTAISPSPPPKPNTPNTRMGLGAVMCRIGGRLRSAYASRVGVIVEIPPLAVFGSNPGKTGEQCLVGS